MKNVTPQEFKYFMLVTNRNMYASNLDVENMLMNMLFGNYQNALHVLIKDYICEQCFVTDNMLFARNISSCSMNCAVCESISL